MSGKEIATTLSVHPGWRALFYVVNEQGQPATMQHGMMAVREMPIEAWGVLLAPSHIGALTPSWFGRNGESGIELVPLGLLCHRLDKQPGYIGTIPPSETIEMAIKRIGPPLFKANAEPVKVAP